MHVVQIIPTLSIGGAERVVVDLVNHASSDIRHSVILLKSVKPLATALCDDVSLHILQKKHVIGYHLAGDIVRLLKKIKPHVVHTHLFGADVWGGIAARRLSIPVVTTEHNINHDEGVAKRLIKWSLSEYAKQYIAPSDAIADYTHRTYGVARKKILVIRNGIDVTRFSHAKKRHMQQPVKLLMIGRLVEQKGQDIALRALEQIAALPWTLTIVGDGPKKDALQALVHRLGFSERVTFLPATPKPETLYMQHDIVLVPSRWEGLGLVVMEAMAAGRVVIGAKTGGILELIDDKKTGLLAESEPVVFGKTIEWALTHEEKTCAIAEKAKQIAKKEFTIEKMVASYEAIYRNIV